MFKFMLSEASRLANAITIGAKDRVTDEEFITREIRKFKVSKKRHDMVTGEKYYKGEHDILSRQRTVIGADGKLQAVDNLPNNKIVDNQYKKMVDQKTNYLLGQPFSIQCKNEAYMKALMLVLNNRFRRILKSIGEDSFNGGLGWMYVYYNDKGEFSFRRFRPFEIIPEWKDAEHTELDYAIRLYEVIEYTRKQEKVIEKVEIYDADGIHFYELDGSHLKPVEPYHQNYFIATDESGKATSYNWAKIPLIPFKYNSNEIPLIRPVKSLQDGLNTIISNFQNAMEEDTRNTILVLVNYDGQNLGEFRKNLAQYGAVKIKTVDGAPGDLKTLQIEVNSDNYKAIIELFKKAIIENAMGYDAKDDRLSGNPNQMNIQSMYSDIDLDANGMETEYQASFEELLWFINCHFANVGIGDFEGEKVDIIFNRDMLISEGDVIDNISKSVGILSNETLVAQHPWVEDVPAELERIEKEKQENLEQYGGDFGQGGLEGAQGGDE